jgi:hypothetical protein
MPTVRLVPITDEADFPYEEAKRLLERDADLTPKDFGPLVAAGRRMHWTEAMLRANEELAERGNCYDFRLRAEPLLAGSLFEDNVFFSITGDERAALAYIRGLARVLGVRVYRH